jgi:hypothetical protein
MSKYVSSSIALLAMLLATPLLAQGSGRDGSGPFQPHPFKDRACLRECRSDELACLKDVREAAAPCFQGCSALVDAAHAACEMDPAGDACHSAVAAARACVAPCYDEYGPAMQACKREGRECVRACPYLGEPPCHADCRGDHVHCVADARAALTECRAGCDDEFKAARSACVADPDSVACAAALEALHACLEPCRNALKSDLDACGEALRQCVQGCDDHSTTAQ